MGNKYHINQAGNPSVCKAELKCPYGDLVREHFTTLVEARAEVEKRAKNANSVLKSQSRKFNPDAEIPKMYRNFSSSYIKGDTWNEAFASIIKGYEESKDAEDLAELQLEIDKRIIPSIYTDSYSYSSLYPGGPDDDPFQDVRLDFEFGSGDPDETEAGVAKNFGVSEDKVSNETDYYDESNTISVKVPLTGDLRDRVEAAQKRTQLQKPYGILKNPELPNWSSLGIRYSYSTVYGSYSAIYGRTYSSNVKVTINSTGKLEVISDETRKAANRIKVIEDTIGKVDGNLAKAQNEKKNVEKQIAELKDNLGKISNRDLWKAGNDLLKTAERKVRSIDGRITKSKKTIQNVDALAKELKDLKKQHGEFQKKDDDELKRVFISEMTERYPNSNKVTSRNEALAWLKAHPESFRQNWL